jgi:Condensation domain
LPGLLAAPASYFQRLHLERSEDGQLVHNVGLLWRLRGPLDCGALQGALAAMVERHEVLRSALRRTRDGVVQVITHQVDVPFEVASLPTTRRWRALQRLVREQTGRAFDLTCPPLLRVAVVRLGEQEHVLLIAASHAIWDGWSTGIALDDIAASYEALHAGTDPDLPPLALQYADHVKQPAVNDHPARHRLRISRDAGQRSYDAAAHPFSAASGAVAGRLQVVARQHGATMAIVMLAALATVLRTALNEDPAWIAINDANRDEPSSRALIGPFLSFLLVGVRIDPARSLADAVARTRDRVLDAYRRRQFVDEDACPPSASAPVIGDAWLNVFPRLGAFAAASHPRVVAGLKINPIGTVGASEPRWNDGALGLTVREAPTGSLEATFVYDASLLTSDEIAKLATLYRTSLRTLAVDPGRVPPPLC